MPKLADELEQFEAELKQDDDDELESISKPSVDKVDDEDEEKDAPPEQDDESSQEADSDNEPEDQDEPEAESREDEPAPEKKPKKLTTLPDDPDTFGEWAGKEITEEQLAESGLLPKLITWGHQGRHLVQKTQAELEAAKAEKSEAAKLRELLEDQFKRENEMRDKAVQQDGPKVSEEEFAEALVREYIPGLQTVAEQGGVEVDFLKEFPKAAAHFEHRFQSGSNLIEVLVKELTEIKEFVGMQKERIEKEEVVQKEQTATQTFAQTVASVASKEGELFAPLSDAEVQKDFVRWITRDDSDLRIADKDMAEITAGDVSGAWLLYVHEHPDVVKPRKKETNSHLAGGGGGRGTSKSKSKAAPQDELSTFEAELREAEKAGFEE